MSSQHRLALLHFHSSDSPGPLFSLCINITAIASLLGSLLLVSSSNDFLHSCQSGLSKAVFVTLCNFQKCFFLYLLYSSMKILSNFTFCCLYHKNKRYRDMLWKSESPKIWAWLSIGPPTSRTNTVVSINLFKIPQWFYIT